MSTIKVALTSGNYKTIMTITKSLIPGVFDSDWTCDLDDAFSESSGKAANLLGSPDLSILGSGGQTLGLLLAFTGSDSGNGEHYDEGKLQSSFKWVKQ